MKSKQTQTKEISYSTRQKVLDRQGNRSVTGVYLTPSNTHFHHFVFRSGGGVGFEWNIIALTVEEHDSIHNHKPVMMNGKVKYTWDELQSLMRNHLLKHYVGWSEEKCRYKKWFEEKDYQVTRRVWK